MTNAATLINIARINQDAPTDAALAELVGVGVGSISAWRLRRQPVPLARIVRLCELADESPALWFGLLGMDAATDQGVHGAWAMAVDAVRAQLKGRG